MSERSDQQLLKELFEQNKKLAAQLSARQQEDRNASGNKKMMEKLLQQNEKLTLQLAAAEAAAEERRMEEESDDVDADLQDSEGTQIPTPMCRTHAHANKRTCPYRCIHTHTHTHTHTYTQSRSRARMARHGRFTLPLTPV